MSALLYTIGLLFMSFLVFSEMRQIISNPMDFYLNLILSILCGIFWPIIAFIYIGNKINDMWFKWFDNKEEN